METVVRKRVKVKRISIAKYSTLSTWAAQASAKHTQQFEGA